ncbi:MAG: PAS domain-containing protein, partial [Alphaproteobacteria bacterium]|nr:PAS domain-containing protein [Alphaproteobacteria bacterium]
VSKTDLKGRITYCNDVLMRIAGYSESELIGQPHSILRHKAMPRCVFKLLWDTIQAGHEIFAYVVNRSKHDDYYWVFAHVTPDYSPNGELVGYTSFRRSVERRAIDAISPVYAALLEEEARFANRKEGMQSSFNMVLNLLADKGMAYDELVFSL